MNTQQVHNMSVALAPALDLAELLKDVPRGAWVAISVNNGARVIAYGSDINRVLADARLKGESDPIIMRVPETSTSLML